MLILEENIFFNIMRIENRVFKTVILKKEQELKIFISIIRNLFFQAWIVNEFLESKRSRL